MTSKEAAEYLGLSHWYIRNMRQGMHEWEGPACTYKPGRGGPHCVYLKADLDIWAKKTKGLRSKGKKGRRKSKLTQLAGMLHPDMIYS